MINAILVWKFLKFCIVGSSGMLVDFSTTWLLKEKVKINKYIANSAGFILAATSNYLLNRFWTFQSDNTRVVTEYLTFILISIIGLGINNAVVYLLTERIRFNFYLSKLFATGVVTLWNFSMNYLFTFS
jgi:putative flippase GtrA